MSTMASFEKMPIAEVDFFEQLAGDVSPQTILRRNEPLARRTTLRVGGACDAYAEPANETDLRNLVRLSAKCHVPFFILGRGSNVIVRDAGYRGLVICLSQPFFSRIEVHGQELRCGAGARLKVISVEARRQGIAGFEFLEGIPGTLGGALRMNAGAMSGATFDVVHSVRAMDRAGNLQEIRASELDVAYRCCESLRKVIALEALMRGISAPAREIEKRMADYSRKRWSSQPAALSAGCMFKNTASIPAGKLIDELGLKGTRVGGAMVSHEHGNFIVNDGTATAKQVLELIELIREKAKTLRGIELHTEVEVIGEE